jgi:hypothetical protein
MMSVFKRAVWNETITIYNRYQTLVSGKTTTKWNRTVLSDCFFGHQKNQTVDGLTIVSSNTFIVRIPANSAYLSPEEYYAADNAIKLFSNSFETINAQLSAAQIFYLTNNSYEIITAELDTKTGKFTVNKGDIIVRGSVTDTLADNDSGSALLTKYFGRAFTVNRAVDNSKLEYTGHYLASEEYQWR